MPVDNESNYIIWEPRVHRPQICYGTWAVQFSHPWSTARSGLTEWLPTSTTPPAVTSDKWWSPLPRVSKMLRLVLTCSSHRAQQQGLTLRYEECLAVSSFSPFTPGTSWAAEVLLQCYRDGSRTGDPSFDLFSLLFLFTRIFFAWLLFFCQRKLVHHSPAMRQ